MINKNTKITLGAVISVLTFLLSVAFGVDYHVKSQVDPIRSRIMKIDDKVDKIYEILILKEGK